MCGVPVQRADDYLAAADRARATGSPSASRSRIRRRRKKRGAKGGGPARRGAPRHAGHDDRGAAARCRAAHNFLARARARASPGEWRVWRSPRSISPPATSPSASRDRPAAAGRDRRGWSRARSCCPDTLLADAALARVLAREPGAALTPLPASALRCSDAAERRLKELVRRRDARWLRRLPPRRDRRRGRRSSTMSSAPRSASARRSSPPRRERAGAAHADRRGDPRQSRAHARRWRASAPGSLLATIDRTVTAAGARVLGERLAAR